MIEAHCALPELHSPGIPWAHPPQLQGSMTVTSGGLKETPNHFCGPLFPSLQGRIGQGLEQPGPVEGDPAHSRELKLLGLYRLFQPKPFHDSIILLKMTEPMTNYHVKCAWVCSPSPDALSANATVQNQEVRLTNQGWGQAQSQLQVTQLTGLPPAPSSCVQHPWEGSTFPAKCILCTRVKPTSRPLDTPCTGKQLLCPIIKH